MTSKLALLTAVFLLLSSFVATKVEGQEEKLHDATATPTPKDIVIAGYLPDYRSYININATAPYLTDLILFSLIPHSQRGMLGGCCLNDHHFQQAHEAQALADDSLSSPLRIWVTVGGGGGERSEPFAKVATDPKKRKRLIESLKRLW